MSKLGDSHEASDGMCCAVAMNVFVSLYLALRCQWIKVKDIAGLGKDKGEQKTQSEILRC